MQKTEQKCKKCRKKASKNVKNYQTVEKTALKMENFWKKLQRSRGKSVNKENRQKILKICKKIHQKVEKLLSICHLCAKKL